MKLEIAFKDQIFPSGTFGQAHASTLLRLPDGSFLASWFAGTKEGDPDVSIYGSRFIKGKWSKPKTWARANEMAHLNPVLFQLPNGPLALFFKTGVFCDTWITWICHSHDGGATWSKPVELVKGDIGGRGPVKNKPILLSDGAILAPASLELDGPWRCFTDRSEDGGKTWIASPEIPMDRTQLTGKGAIQPTIWESGKGHVHMLVRTSAGSIFRSDSSNYGRNWSPLMKTKLPNNNSGIDLDHDARGNLLLAYNPVDGNFGPRTPLTLASSQDNGESWSKALDLETNLGEYSYPAIIATPDGFAGTYTWKRESIVFWKAKTSA